MFDEALGSFKIGKHTAHNEVAEEKKQEDKQLCDLFSKANPKELAQMPDPDPFSDDQ